jgi:hypothetical protein
MIWVIGGDPVLAEIASPTSSIKDDGRPGRRRGSYDRGSRVTPVEERTLTSDVLLKKERRGDWR